MSISDLISVREFRPKDLNFILDSSLQCLSKYQESIFKGWRKRDIYQHIEKLVLFVMNDINYSTFICCLKEDSEYIIGYVIGNPTTNHIFLQYTKYSYRKLGLQKNFLLPLVVDFNEPISANFPTKEMLKLEKSDRITIVNKMIEQLMNDMVEIKGYEQVREGRFS